MKLQDLLENTDYNTMPEKELLQLVRKAGYKELYDIIDSLSVIPEKVQVAAVNNHNMVIANIFNPCCKAQVAAVRKSALNLQRIKDPCEKAQIVAVSAKMYGNNAIDNLTSRNIPLSEPVLIAAVTRASTYIRNIPNPSEAVIEAALLSGFNNATNILNKRNIAIPNNVLNTVLSNERFITYDPERYDNSVKNYFKDNTILANKWIRYAENIRGM
jgi:hypothetical protein